MVSLVVLGDLEFSGMFFGRYEKIALEKLGPKPQRLADQIRNHARDTNSELILDWLSEADIAFANLETTLTKARDYYHPHPSYYRLRADPSNAEDLRSLGIDVVSLANNHQFDCGDEGLIDTIKALEGAGIKYMGAGMNLEEALSPAIINVRGEKIAFLGFATVCQKHASSDNSGVAGIRKKIIYEFESSSLPTTYLPLYASLPTIKEIPNEEDVQRMQDCIERVKDEVDFVVVSIHWGPGIAIRSGGKLSTYIFEAIPTDCQRLLGHSIVDAGADLVIGGHPHSSQGIEFYKDKPIFYSLANTAMQIESDIARCVLFMQTAYMVKIDIEKKKSMKVEILPTRTDETGLPMITEDYKNVIEYLKEASLSLNASVIPLEKGAIVEPINHHRTL